MASQTIYPYGPSQVQPEGVVAEKIVEMEQAFRTLAPWAFRETPNVANPAFRRGLIYPTTTAGVGIVRYGFSAAAGNNNYIMSPLIDLGDIGQSRTLRVSTGQTTTSTTTPSFLILDENMLPWTRYSIPDGVRTITPIVTSNLKYARLIFLLDHVYDAYIYDESNGRYLFEGAALDLSQIGDEEDLRKSQYWKADWEPNSRGDWIGWNFNSVDSVGSAFRTYIDYPICRQIGQNATGFSFSVGKIIELPSKMTVDIEFSCGEVDSDLVLRVLNPDAGTAGYCLANASPRTVNINTSTWTHAQLYFRTANYANCYIKDATNNVMLWQGASSTD